MRFSIRYYGGPQAGDEVMGNLELDNIYIKTYGKIVEGYQKPEDLHVNEFTLKEYALSGQKATVYMVIRVQ